MQKAIQTGFFGALLIVAFVVGMSILGVDVLAIAFFSIILVVALVRRVMIEIMAHKYGNIVYDIFPPFFSK